MAGCNSLPEVARAPHCEATIPSVGMVNSSDSFEDNLICHVFTSWQGNRVGVHSCTLNSPAAQKPVRPGHLQAGNHTCATAAEATSAAAALPSDTAEAAAAGVSGSRDRAAAEAAGGSDAAKRRAFSASAFSCCSIYNSTILNSFNSCPSSGKKIIHSQPFSQHCTCCSLEYGMQASTLSNTAIAMELIPVEACEKQASNMTHINTTSRPLQSWDAKYDRLGASSQSGHL